MKHSRFGLQICCFLLAATLFAMPVSAFVIGSKEDLEHLAPNPENSEPVTGENAAPIATNLELFTYRNVTLSERLSAFDPEGDLVTFRVTKNPARGAVTVEEDGSFTYAPYENKTGKDSFTYVAEDTKGNVSTPATVKLRIQKQRSKVCYADMTDHPAHKAAVRLAELDVLVGQRIGDAYFFTPNETVSREQFLSLAMATLQTKLLPDAMTTGFSDDASIAVWAKPYVATALHNGLIRGSADATGGVVFDAERSMTRGEASVLLNRLLQLSNVNETEASAPTWAAQSVANLSAAGVMDEASGLEADLTKAEAAVLLSGALDVLEFREHGTTSLF